MVEHTYEEDYLELSEEEILSSPASSQIFLPLSYVTRCRLCLTGYLTKMEEDWLNPNGEIVNIFIDKTYA